MKLLQELLDLAAPVLEEQQVEQLDEWSSNKDFDKLWEKYVPIEGEAETEFGEAIRALGRIEYECYNNGNCNVESGDTFYNKMWKHLGKALKELKADEFVLKAYNQVKPKPDMGIRHPTAAFNTHRKLKYQGVEALPPAHPDRLKLDNAKRKIDEYYKKQSVKFKGDVPAYEILKDFLVKNQPTVKAA